MDPVSINYYYYPHFTGKKRSPREVMELAQSRTVGKWLDWDLNRDRVLTFNYPRVHPTLTVTWGTCSSRGPSGEFLCNFS